MNLDKRFFEECASEADGLIDWGMASKLGGWSENHAVVGKLKELLHGYGLQVAQITAKRMVEIAKKESKGRSKGG